MELETKPIMSKTNRKIAKPIMEKKRRARINASLNELKSLLVEVLQKEGCRHSSKMEKADILEMAVRHLRSLQQSQQFQGVNVQTRDSFSHHHRTESKREKISPTSYPECLPQIPSFKPTELAKGPSTRLQSHSEDVPLNLNISNSQVKPDMNKNLLPAPQPIMINPQAQNLPVMTKTASGEIAVLLPQNFLKSPVANTGSGYILPLYTVPQNGTPAVRPMNDHPMNEHPLMISINIPPQQSMVNNPHNIKPAPVSPVWRPW